MLASELDGMHQDGSFSHVMARTAAESLTFDETRHLASRTALVPKTWPPRLGHLIGPKAGCESHPASKLDATQRKLNSGYTAWLDGYARCALSVLGHYSTSRGPLNCARLSLSTSNHYCMDAPHYLTHSHCYTYTIWIQTVAAISYPSR